MDIIKDTEGWYLHGFPCCYYSQYREESEYLFCGGHYPLKIESVRNMVTCQNYESSIKPLAQFSKLFDGYVPGRMNNKDRSLVVDLCDYSFGFVVDKNIKISEYIYKCFKAFSQNKTYIVLNTDWMNGTYKEFKKMLYHDIKGYKCWDDVNDKISDKNKFNLFKSDLFRLLPNLQTIVLITTTGDGTDVYPLSFLCLLSEIENTSLNKLIIKAIRATRYGYDKSWLLDIWSTSKEQVSKLFANKNYQIKYQTQTNSFAYTEDIVIISKNK